jgi:hypothetical protein
MESVQKNATSIWLLSGLSMRIRNPTLFVSGWRLSALAHDVAQDLLRGAQVLQQESPGRGEIFAQNCVDDLEMLANAQFALLNRVKRAQKLKLDDEVDESSTFLEE